MMLVTISIIAIILNPTFVTAQSCNAAVPDCALIHEDAWDPMQNAYKQIRDAIDDHDIDIKQRLFQFQQGAMGAIGTIAGDINGIESDINNIEGDIINIQGAIGNIAGDI
eukprot:396132_1